MKSFEVFFWFVGTMAVALMFLIGLMHRRRARVGKVPVSEKMLRPPGESLRLYLKKLDEKLFGKICGLIGGCLIASVFFHIAFDTWRLSWLIALILIVIGVVPIGFFIRSLLKLQKLYSRNVLGFYGERVVGEHLNKLMLDDCEVFHDLQVDGKWNIDHIVVSQRGVFAVETKARRKPNVENGHIVTFTGEELRFPTWTERQCLQQTDSAARWLAKFLSQSTGYPTNVAPILTFPGWYIELKGNNSVRVLNPKNIATVVLDPRLPQLDEAQRKRICYQLDQRCRDVEV